MTDRDAVHVLVVAHGPPLRGGIATVALDLVDGADREALARLLALWTDDIERLMADAGIVRHRGKIEAAVANASAVLDVQARHGSLAALIWSFEPTRRGRPVPIELGEIAARTEQSTALAKELKRFGFRFIGPTTAYAAMQSVGVVNDHLRGCHVRSACDADRRATTVPTLTT